MLRYASNKISDVSTPSSIGDGNSCKISFSSVFFLSVLLITILLRKLILPISNLIRRTYICTYIKDDLLTFERVVAVVGLQLIKPVEMCNPKVDELSMMTYLSQFPHCKLKPGAPLRPKTNPARVRAYGPGMWSYRTSGSAGISKLNHLLDGYLFTHRFEFHIFPFFWFSITILSDTLILHVSQLQTQKLMKSQIRLGFNTI